MKYLCEDSTVRFAVNYILCTAQKYSNSEVQMVVPTLIHLVSLFHTAVLFTTHDLHAKHSAPVTPSLSLFRPLQRRCFSFTLQSKLPTKADCIGKQLKSLFLPLFNRFLPNRLLSTIKNINLYANFPKKHSKKVTLN